MNYLGLTGLTDRRADLPRNARGGPNTQRPVASKLGIVLHYNGPAVPATMDDWALIRADAAYHIAKDWSLGELGVQQGDGLMYHLAIARDGRAWLTRSFNDCLWHCGTIKNYSALAWMLVMGGNQRATVAQLDTLARLTNEAVAAGLTMPSTVRGHMEESATSCPGTLMKDFVIPYRAGAYPDGGAVADGQYFHETGYYVGGGFYRFWVDNGGLRIFGYPVSDEFATPDEWAPTGLRTIQVFERSVMEYWPENPAASVTLRLCGNDLLAAGIITPP